jgi:glycosyltransferase involved in cell wall biosynthesis
MEVLSIAKDCLRPGQRTDGHLRLLAVGRLAFEKGHDVLLRALAQAGPALPPWSLTVLGEGPLRGELLRLAAELGIADRCEFPGYVADPYALMVTSDIYIHPSRWEGFGLSLLEAMALGLPVIATSCPGGPKEILENGAHGVLVPPEDVGALAGAIIRLAIDRTLREELGDTAARRASAYSPRAVAARLLQLAKEIGLA